MANFTVKSKVWIEDSSGKVVFGAGRLKILELVKELGSIHLAARALKMSYRAVWGKIRATEERLGQPLVVRNPDGTRRGGSKLTPFACFIMERFKQLESFHEKQADELFGTFFLPGLDKGGEPVQFPKYEKLSDQNESK